jgi:hypothetical protein
VYKALNRGRVQVARLRWALAALPLRAWDDGRIRLAVDVSNWLRLDTATSPERLFCHVASCRAPVLRARQSLKGQGLRWLESRVSPVWPRNPVIRAGRRWMRSSWWRIAAASWPFPPGPFEARAFPPPACQACRHW